MAVGEEGARLLREACAALGQDSNLGNKIAEWLNKHPTAEVTIRGRSPEPPLRVFGTPDE